MIPTDPPGRPGPGESNQAGPDSEEPSTQRPAAAASSSGRPGSGTFTIEGRAAPGLFVVGWLATIVGAGCVGVALLSWGRGAALLLALVGLVLLSVGLIAGAGSQGIERRNRGVAPYRGPSPILVFAATIPLSYLGVIAVGALMAGAGIKIDGPVGQLAAVLIQTLIYIAVVRLLVVDTGALSWSEMGIGPPDRAALVRLAWGALAAGPVILVTAAVAVAASRLTTATPESPLPPTGEATGFALQFLAGVVVAPIGEEIMFRAFATTAWSRAFGVTRAVIQGGLFFALVHVINQAGATAEAALALAAVAFVTRIPVALVLGWLFVRHRSIWAPLGLHATFNAILLVLGEMAFRSG